MICSASADQPETKLTVDLLIPCIEVPVRENDFGVRIRLDQFFGEQDGRYVRDALTMSEQLVELGASVRLALTVELGFDRFQPHLVVAGIIEKRLPAMIALVDPEMSERVTGRCSPRQSRSTRRRACGRTFCRCSTHPQHEHLHGCHASAILLPVDVGHYTLVVRECCRLGHNFLLDDTVYNLAAGHSPEMNE